MLFAAVVRKSEGQCILTICQCPFKLPEAVSDTISDHRIFSSTYLEVPAVFVFPRTTLPSMKPIMSMIFAFVYF
jgi:hypothetical protein